MVHVTDFSKMTVRCSRTSEPIPTLGGNPFPPLLNADNRFLQEAIYNSWTLTSRRQTMGGNKVSRHKLFWLES